MAVLAHAGGLFGGFVVPLIVYTMSRGEHERFARQEAAEALNFQITLMLPMLVGVFLLFGGMATMAGSVGGQGGMAGFFIVFLVVWLFAFVAGIGNLVCSIIGMVRAGRWQHYRYPVNIRFVKP
jgi:uncharacterized Tic20 family protein